MAKKRKKQNIILPSLLIIALVFSSFALFSFAEEGTITGLFSLKDLRIIKTIRLGGEKEEQANLAVKDVEKIKSPVRLPESAFIEPINLYVSPSGNDAAAGTKEEPFKTIQRAKEKIRELKRAGELSAPINVFLREGTYYLTEPIIFTTEDSGTEAAPITYQAYPEEKVVVSGGRRITSAWRRYNDNIYVTNAGWDFNSLFVNGKRAVRARDPNVGEEFPFHLIASIDEDTKYNAFRFNEGDIDGSWRNLRDIEVATYIRFTQPRMKIDRVEGNKVYFQGNVRSSGWMARGYGSDYDSTTARYFVDNVFEKLDNPGEWYLDKTTNELYYWPLTGEDIETAEIIAPVVKQLIDSEYDLHEKDELTTSMFIKPEMCRWNDNAASYIFYIGPYLLYCRDEGDTARFIGSIYVDGVKKELGTATRTLPYDEWVHIAMTFDGDEFKLYTNGGAPRTIAASGNIESPAGHADARDYFLSLGAIRNSFYFNGALDEIKFWNRALSEAEIAELYSLNPVSENGLLLDMDFDRSVLEDNLRHNVIGDEDIAFVEGIKGRAVSLAADDKLLVGANLNYLNFKGIQFMHTDWELPDAGDIGGIAGGEFTTPPAIRLILNNGEFNNNVVSHIGGDALHSYSSNLQILNNELYDIGGQGIKLGKNLDFWTINPYRGLVEENTVSDNRIHDVGIIYKAANGIHFQFTGENIISHNEIYDLAYTGINSQCMYDLRETNCRNNNVEYNKLYNMMTELNDGGGIHILGTQPGTVIQNNEIYDILLASRHLHQYPTIAIYLDEASKDIVVRNNIAYNIHGPVLNFHRAVDNIIENNIFVDGEKSQVAFFSSTRPDLYAGTTPSGNILRKNIFYYTNTTADTILRISGSVLIYPYPTTQPNMVESSDYNLFYSPSHETNPNWNLNEWQTEYGYDEHSVVADPMFVDYDNKDFRLQPGSPAFDLGFEQIDLTNVGPRTECFDDTMCSRGQCIQMKCVEGKSICNNNGVCNEGETSENCPGDCPVKKAPLSSKPTFSLKSIFSRQDYSLVLYLQKPKQMFKYP